MFSLPGSSPLRAGAIPPSAGLSTSSRRSAVAVPFAPGRFLLQIKTILRRIKKMK